MADLLRGLFAYALVSYVTGLVFMALMRRAEWRTMANPPSRIRQVATVALWPLLPVLALALFVRN